MEPKKTIRLLVIASLLSGCMTVNSDTTKVMSDGKLCELLGPMWITTSSERDAIYREIEERGLLCSDGQVVSYGQGRAREDSPQPKGRTASTGSGFIVSPVGHVITNSHVVSNCKQLSVRAPAEIVEARVLAQDPANDLALLSTGVIRPSQHATFRSSRPLRVGEEVTVVGFPLGSLLGTSIKATEGTISSLTGLNNDTRMMQITAPIQPGNSGGPLLDDGGYVIGVVTAKLDEIAVAENIGSLPQNVNFALKGSIVINFLSAHGLEGPLVTTETTKVRADAVETAKGFSVMVTCEH